MLPRTLRAKTAWMVAGVAGFLTIPIAIGLWTALAPGYQRADRMMSSKEIVRIEQFFQLRFRDALAEARDEAVWNGMARWICERDPVFAYDNLKPENLASRSFRWLSLRDSMGAEILELNDNLPRELSEWGNAKAKEWAARRDTASFARWFLRDRKVWLLVGQPVRGSTYLERRVVGLLIAAVQADSGGVYTGVIDSFAATPASIGSSDSIDIAGYFPGTAKAGPPDFKLRIWRAAWVEGRRTLGLLVGCVFLFSILFVAILLQLLDKALLRRLSALHEDLERIRARPVRGGRLRDLGTDEIGGFAKQLNTTFDALEDSQRHLADAQWIARIGFIRLDPKSLWAKVSTEHIETAGLDVEPEELGLSFDDYLQRFVHPEDRERLRSWIGSALRQAPEGIVGDLEYRITGREGDIRHLLAACRKREEEGNALFLVIQDVTDRRRMEDELLRGNLYDALTGLPNRSLVLDRIRTIVDPASHAHCSVLAFSLDRFQAINASLGRDVGEGLLLGISVRLVGALPSGVTVGRMSHESFSVLLETDDLSEINRLAEHLRRVVRAPLPMGDRELVLTASIGVARARSGECSAEELLSRAESAQYQAAGRGGDCIAIFDEERSRRAREKVDLEMELGNAIPDQLELHYQPIVHLDDGRVAGFESLIRWRHPERGLVSPMLFIPIAERTGLIHEIGIWVMQEAMRVEAGWQAEFGAEAPFMSINLSVKQFLHDDLADQIRSCLDKTGVDPKGIKLEITESALSEDPAHVTQLLENLVSKGISFSLDDFGTGYSSLGYLSSFPVKTLKVDKSFVDQLGEDGKKTRITAAIVSLAHTLGMDVVAEGIEHEAQWNRLRALKCEFGQGYHFSRPLPLAQAQAYLHAQKNR